MVSLWVLPGLVAALTPIRARDVLGESRDSLITAFIAGDLFIVLPGLMQASRTLLGRLSPGDDGAGPADGGHRAGLLQLPAHGEAPLPELHPLRGMVRRRAGAAVGLSPAGARRARDLLRQPHRGRAVSPRPVPDSSRYVSAVSRDGRHQLARGVARGGGAHADGGAPRRLRRHRPPSLAARTAPVVRRLHRGARRSWSSAARACSLPPACPRSIRRTTCWRRCTCSTSRSTPPWHARRRRHPSRTCRRSRPSTRARCCASATCPTRCPSRSSISDGRPGGLRRRARASPGARDGRQPRLRARRS